jgi:hypothetical protein
MACLRLQEIAGCLDRRKGARKGARGNMRLKWIFPLVLLAGCFCPSPEIAQSTQGHLVDFLERLAPVPGVGEKRGQGVDVHSTPADRAGSENASLNATGRGTAQAHPAGT